jgi:hypothetical protein
MLEKEEICLFVWLYSFEFFGRIIIVVSYGRKDQRDSDIEGHSLEGRGS